ncbi:hypothetical protein, variant 1 [Aphanomyces astaci]|uniref:PH domain-containing protein n=1 Tax=Aphanomyces astaci TaxID=112090 RepID=W4FG55_APHAT|nr:hypothetical protein, variant 1 [Aphanomyces astaci]ETV65713.1 hypothetical protein, variant 1 [Aphanomyces astaci]|eukprot:XP_009844820.1 hypothetical protein, variant 1 [Aphanomyces astaci]
MFALSSRSKALQRETPIKDIDERTFVQVDVYFQERSLGVQFTPVPSDVVAPFHLHAQVADVHRLPNGERSPIDMANLRAPTPSRRVSRGMRLSWINSTPLTHVAFSSVISMLSSARRPLVLRFEDCHQPRGLSASPPPPPPPLALPIMPSLPPPTTPLPPHSLSWITPYIAMVGVIFPPGRLGLHLAPICDDVISRCHSLSTRIAALVPHPLGVPTLASRYNAVAYDQGHMRLTPGLAIAAINFHSVAGLCHSDVVDRIRRLVRPTTLHFCDLSKGISHDVAASETSSLPVRIPWNATPTQQLTTLEQPPDHTSMATSTSSTSSTSSSSITTSTKLVVGATTAVAPCGSSLYMGSHVLAMARVHPTPPRSVRHAPNVPNRSVYSWIWSTQVEFCEILYGMKTQEYTGSDFAEFHVELDAIPPDGALAKWNANAPTLEVVATMRLVCIGNQGLQHKSYDQVLALLRSASRPVSITFADTSKSTVEDKEYEAYMESVKPVAATSSWWGTSAALVRPVQYLVPISISFNDGPLGLETQDVSETRSNVPLYVQVHAIVQILESGEFGPVSRYNWSHPAALRLHPGMRIYQVNAKVMWQCSYNEVLDAIRHAHRPVVVVFVNIDGPTCCDSIQELKDTSIQELKDHSILEHQQLYRRHMYQLDAIDTLEAAQDMRRLYWVQQIRHLNQFQALVAAKVLRMNRILADLANHSVAWHHRIADLNHDRQRYQSLLDALAAQAQGQMDNPLLIRANRLDERATKLHDRVRKLEADHKKLKVRHKGLTNQRQELEAMLPNEDEEEKVSQARKTAAKLFDVDILLPLQDQLALFKRHFKDVQKEYQQEDRRRQLVQREVAYMRQHVKSLVKAEKKMKKTAKLKPSKTDTRISTLREKLKSINDQLAAAADSGDNEHAAKLSKRRKHLTKELRAALYDQDKKNTLKVPSKGFYKTNNVIAEMNHPQPTTPTTKARPLAYFFIDGTLDKHPTISNETDIFTSGWKHFKKAYPRYCTITTHGSLAYFRQPGDAHARGELNLADRSLEIAVHGCEFTLCTNTESTKFHAKSTRDCRKWVDAIQAANAHFTKTHKSMTKT